MDNFAQSFETLNKTVYELQTIVTSGMDEAKKKGAAHEEAFSKFQEENAEKIKKIEEDITKASQNFADEKRKYEQLSKATKSHKDEIAHQYQEEIKDIGRAQFCDQIYKTNFSAKKEEKYKTLINEKFSQITTTTSGSTSEWIGVEYINSLQDIIRITPVLESLFRPYTIPAGAKTFHIPQQTALGWENSANHWNYTGVESKAEGTALTNKQNPTSAETTFTAQNIAAFYETTYEVEEESYLNEIDIIVASAVESHNHAKEYTWANGATTASHILSAGSFGTNSPAATMNGITQAGLQGSAKASAGGTLATSQFRTVRGLMGASGISPMRVNIATGITGYMAMLGLGEVLTMDKYGDKATVKTGELGRFDGMRIFVSAAIYDANASGIYDTATPANNSLGKILLVNDGIYWNAQRSGYIIETDKSITAQTKQFVISQKMKLVKASPTTNGVGLIYNI